MNRFQLRPRPRPGTPPKNIVLYSPPQEESPPPTPQDPKPKPKPKPSTTPKSLARPPAPTLYDCDRPYSPSSGRKKISSSSVSTTPNHNLGEMTLQAKHDNLKQKFKKMLAQLQAAQASNEVMKTNWANIKTDNDAFHRKIYQFGEYKEHADRKFHQMKTMLEKKVRAGTVRELVLQKKRSDLQEEAAKKLTEDTKKSKGNSRP